MTLGRAGELKAVEVSGDDDEVRRVAHVLPLCRQIELTAGRPQVFWVKIVLPVGFTPRDEQASVVGSSHQADDFQCFLISCPPSCVVWRHATSLRQGIRVSLGISSVPWATEYSLPHSHPTVSKSLLHPVHGSGGPIPHDCVWLDGRWRRVWSCVLHAPVLCTVRWPTLFPPCKRSGSVGQW